MLINVNTTRIIKNRLSAAPVTAAGGITVLALSLTLFLHAAMNRLVLAILIALLPFHAGAEFALNFNNIDQQQTTAIHHGEVGLINQTPYLSPSTLQMPEIIYDPVTDKNYYHMIVGSMADGFIQEVYIEKDGVVDFRGGTVSNRYTADDGCGTCWSLDGTPSGGNGDVRLLGDVAANARVVDAANGSRPLSADAGNGTGDPNRVIMRQIINTGELYTEFLKDGYGNKPKITMVMSSPDLLLEFDVDMRNITYSDDTSTAPMINRMWLLGADVHLTSGDFDMSTDTDISEIDAGQYTYTPAALTPGIGEGGGGTYDYARGSFDIDGVNWREFMDPNTNNPWSYEDGKLAP